MKRSTFLKVVFALTMIVMVANVNAQTWDPGTDGYGLTQNTTAITDYVTIGATIPYVVLPDAIFNPNWTGWSEITGFTEGTFTVQGAVDEWTWDFTGATGASISSGTATSNYVTIDFTTTGTKAITVFESNPISTCFDASPVTLNVVVCAEPTISWNAGMADTDFCGTQAAYDLDIDITETGNVAANATFYFTVNLKVDNIDGSGAITGAISNAVVEDQSLGLDLSGTFAAGADTYTFADDLAILNGEPTQYVYTVQNIQSTVSQRSDYEAVRLGGSFTDYDGGVETLTFRVFPTPVTGPIYTSPL